LDENTSEYQVDDPEMRFDSKSSSGKRILAKFAGTLKNQKIGN